MASEVPVLWQIKVSHYNEKARWALDYKRVPHRRRAPMPMFGTVPTAWVLTRGTTFPVLTLDGRSIGDSTRIIAALEERYPEPPLYPPDPRARDRALALEDYFDEELAPQVRRLVWAETVSIPEAFVAAALPDSGDLIRSGMKATARLSAAMVQRRYGAYTENAEAARSAILAAMDRLEAEIGPGGYLVGERFSVADLSAAALFTPLIRPPQRPYLPDTEYPPSLQEFCDRLDERSGAEWVLEMYARHREPASAV